MFSGPSQAYTWTRVAVSPLQMCGSMSSMTRGQVSDTDFPHPYSCLVWTVSSHATQHPCVLVVCPAVPCLCRGSTGRHTHAWDKLVCVCASWQPMRHPDMLCVAVQCSPGLSLGAARHHRWCNQPAAGGAVWRFPAAAARRQGASSLPAPQGAAGALRPGAHTSQGESLPGAACRGGGLCVVCGQDQPWPGHLRSGLHNRHLGT